MDLQPGRTGSRRAVPAQDYLTLVGPRSQLHEDRLVIGEKGVDLLTDRRFRQVPTLVVSEPDYAAVLFLEAPGWTIQFEPQVDCGPAAGQPGLDGFIRARLEAVAELVARQLANLQDRTSTQTGRTIVVVGLASSSAFGC